MHELIPLIQPFSPGAVVPDSGGGLA